jgi:hypothetical protein
MLLGKYGGKLGPVGSLLHCTGVCVPRICKIRVFKPSFQRCGLFGLFAVHSPGSGHATEIV